MTLLEHLLNERAWLYARLREVGQEIKAERERVTVTKTVTQTAHVAAQSLTTSAPGRSMES